MIKEPKVKKLQIKMKNKAKSTGSLNKQSSKENTSKQNRRSPTKHKSAEPSVELSPPNENTPKQNRRSPRKHKSSEPSAEPSPSERATQTPKRRRVESAQSSQTTPKCQKVAAQSTTTKSGNAQVLRKGKSVKRKWDSGPCPNVQLVNENDTFADMEDEENLQSERIHEDLEKVVDDVDEEEENDSDEEEGNTGEDNEMENDNDVPREEETEVVEEPKEKRKYGPRGPTQMQALGLGPGKGMKPTDKRTVCFNSKNQPVGDPSVQLASVLGVLVRRNLPLTKVDWRHVPEGTKDNIWTVVKQRFIVDDFYKDYYVSKMGTYLKEARSRKAGVILKAFKDLEGEAREKRLAEIQPTSMTVQEWKDFIKYVNSPAFKVKRLEMQNVRQKHNTPHTISRKGYARLEEEMQKELDTTEEIPPVELWKTGHKQREGRDPNPGVVEAFDKIKKAQAEQGGESGSTVTDDILAIALGDKDKPGRLRGIGFGPTRKKLETQSHYKKLLKDCQDKFEAMNDRLVTLEEKNLKCVCQEGSHLHRASPNSGNASNNRASTSRTVCANGTASPPIGFGPDSTTPTSSPNGVQKPFKGQECKLLSWYNEGEVVDDATIFETDPEKVVHGFLLGFGAYSVCVLCAHVQKAHLFRPTSEFQFVDEAEGSFFAWPKDKILF